MCWVKSRVYLVYNLDCSFSSVSQAGNCVVLTSASRFLHSTHKIQVLGCPLCGGIYLGDQDSQFLCSRWLFWGDLSDMIFTVDVGSVLNFLYSIVFVRHQKPSPLPLIGA